MEYAIELVNISKDYPESRALSNVSFTVFKNTVHALIGPNGAGKSTCMRIIAGHLTPTSGEVRFADGKAKGSVGLLPDVAPLYPQLKVHEYLKFVSSLYGFKGAELKDVVDRAIYDCGLDGLKERLCRNLSTGQKQKVGVAQALVQGASIIILDEPTAGLDPFAVIEMRTLIQKLAIDHTVMVSTHNLHEVEQICGYVTILKEGVVAKSGALQDILDSSEDKGQKRLRFELKQFNPSILDGLNREYHVRINPSGIAEVILVLPKNDDMAWGRFFIDHGCDLVAMQTLGHDMESAFSTVATSQIAKQDKNTQKESTQWPVN